MDSYFMKLALKEAKKAYNIDEVPIGAVIVKDGKIISTGYNLRESSKDPIAHAEIIAIRKASEVLGGWRLIGCTMYVTIEPCPMCAGAIINSRIDRLVIGAKDPKMGACGSVIDIIQNPKFNHKVDVTWGVLEEECSSIMKNFFKELREKKRR
ncbi:tRNA adenosine(34) deaminase TadA [Caldisalinibacter kiritimatiensis]|uniref:tRNA-specific adenosine deaminase n=1 Tax=Caldisalinibacter kiritimatiensis TaxID=1304284 RepID=R1CPF1_9FIRM|nr:tRNA adenosine(34) deaminase TadA [Caldisalinibacter kiritimatiensis]EOD00541.1 tRNA-specific adenosine-34 deaminase [Caldisalinibacter kiritimatiensis]